MRSAAADRIGIIGRDAINFGRLELGRSFAAQQRQGYGIVIGEAQKAQQDPPPQITRDCTHGFDQHGIHGQIDGG